ncbi:MAG: hypothetical protein A2Y78_04985 [Acidobacteria bacterium RBG_13_68_16]|jgi:hypothetical protein|nr:MAG: hypothetical protein A2Y78_04985 [Acidobacteria bacterium RBG_13_68_16]
MLVELTLAWVTLLPAPQGSDEAPVLRSLEPESIPAYSPVTLKLHGEGFTRDCRVKLGVPGRMVPVPAQLVAPDTLTVDLRLGLGPQPVQRQVVVDCGGGRVTPPLPLTVESPAARPRMGNQAASASAESAPPAPTEAVAAQSTAPTVERLEPPELPAGQAGILTVFGKDFAAGAVVKLLANVNAGTSRAPQYEMKQFDTEVLSDTVLTVQLDRGFSPSPRLRTVVVVNPDGGESTPFILTVTRRQP